MACTMRHHLAHIAVLLLLARLAAADEYPAFCRGVPCPSYSVESKAPLYEIRLYDSTTWASLNVSGVRSSVELAIAKASVPLMKYIKGKNVEGTAVASGKPVAVAVRPKYKFTEIEDTLTVSFYLPTVSSKTAPKPEYEAISIISSPADSQLYVYQFGGFATTGSILSSAAKLATALEDDNLQYDDTAFLFLTYDAPWQLWGRHNEIWISSKWEDLQQKLSHPPVS